MPNPRPRSAPRLSKSPTCYPLAPDRWKDFETLFGPRGACGGCWCMYPRLTAREFSAGKGEPNRHAMRRLVRSGAKPGVIAYHRDEPVGWCALGPRETYPRLAASRILRPVDDKRVWSVVCLFVKRTHRRQGISTQLLKAATAHARTQGARILEGYPHEPQSDAAPDAFIWTGVASAYRSAGFEEVARRSPSRPLMRRTLSASRARS